MRKYMWFNPKNKSNYNYAIFLEFVCLFVILVGVAMLNFLHLGVFTSPLLQYYAFLEVGYVGYIIAVATILCGALGVVNYERKTVQITYIDATEKLTSKYGSIDEAEEIINMVCGERTGKQK